eukprot:1402621-Pyramimonas_sp.AAC.1
MPLLEAPLGKRFCPLPAPLGLEGAPRLERPGIAPRARPSCSRPPPIWRSIGAIKFGLHPRGPKATPR